MMLRCEVMITKRHFLFNLVIVIVPWLTLIFMGKRDIKRYAPAGIFIIIFEILNHLYGHGRKWWKFYDKKPSFLRDELPFSIGPYGPLSMWLLKNSFGNFKKFIILNVIADGLFSFVIIDVLKRVKIIRLNRLSHLQFFVYIHYKAYLLYGFQSLLEKWKDHNHQFIDFS